MHSLLFSIWFFLPAGLANASPVFANKISLINWITTPLDFGKKYRGIRIFGDNKTWRGLIFGTLIGLLVILLQIYGYHHSAWLRSISGGVVYNHSLILLGPLMGFGALLGDAIESFFKRQARVKPGNTWFPFDQIDYIIGGLLFSLPVITLGVKYYFLILVVWLLLHLISSYIGYLVGLKTKPI